MPKGTQVTLNFTGILFEAKDFPNPEEFRPERHLNLRGEFIPNPRVVFYGLGKRRCSNGAIY